MSIGLKSDSNGTSGSIVINGSDKVVITSAGNVTAGTFTGALTGSLTAGGSVTSGVAVASTSGTAIDFTGIPSWVKRVTVMFDNLSVNGTAGILVQIGSGTTQSTGYNSVAAGALSGVAQAFQSSTSGFIIYNDGDSDLKSGNMIINSLGSNIYTSSHTMGGISTRTVMFWGGGGVTLTGALDRVRILATTSNTFDSGTVNIMYEG